MKIHFNLATIAIALVGSSALDTTKNDLLKRLSKHRSLSMPDGVDTFTNKDAFMAASASFFDAWTVEFDSGDATLDNGNFGSSGPVLLDGFFGPGHANGPRRLVKVEGPVSEAPFTYDDTNGSPRLQAFAGSDLYPGLGEEQLQFQCQEEVEERLPEDRKLSEDPIGEYCQCVDELNIWVRRHLQFSALDPCLPSFPGGVTEAFLENKIVNIVGDGVKAQLTVRNNIEPLLLALFSGEVFIDSTGDPRNLQPFGFDSYLSEQEILFFQNLSGCGDGCVHPGFIFTDSAPGTDSQGPLAIGFDLDGQDQDLTVLVGFVDPDCLGMNIPPFVCIDIGVYNIPANTNSFVGTCSGASTQASLTFASTTEQTGFVSNEDQTMLFMLFTGGDEGVEMTFTIDNIVGVNQATPSASPSEMPSAFPSAFPSEMPSTSVLPSAFPSAFPSEMPSADPSSSPSIMPSTSSLPSSSPSESPSEAPAVEDEDDDVCGLGDIPIVGDLLCALPCF